MILRTLGASIRVSGLAIAFSAIGYSASAAEAAITAFKQAVAEAASTDRDIAAFYRSNKFGAVWTGTTDEDRARRSALLSAMKTASKHGLPASRYDTDRLVRVLSDVNSPRKRGFAEVEMTKAFIQVARDMQSGALDPASVDDGIKRNGVYKDANTYLTGLTESGHPRAYFRTLVPQTREYARLMKEKMRLEGLIETGGWGPAVQAGSLEKGQSGQAVVALRDRLMTMGYLGRTSTMVYDDNIEKAVLKFQAAHGLEPDGQAGSNTIDEINTSPATRLASVLVAMERERWLNKERGERHILVNLTDFSARIIDNDIITFETRAVVGANSGDRRSPEFSDVMEHLVINPTWNVPRSITVNEYLPQMQRNPGAAGHLRLYDGSGRQVSRSRVNFNAYNRNNFPFDLKQPPSNGNALGLVKFMFPNKYNIYLHDTPSKHLFAHARRAYSHGCIRLAKPFDFAYEILSKQSDDPKGLFHRILDTGQETQVDLDKEIPVHIIYRTAFTNAKGEPQYRQDVYGRDARIWAAMKNAGVSSPAVYTADMQIPEPQYFSQPQARQTRQSQPRTVQVSQPRTQVRVVNQPRYQARSQPQASQASSLNTRSRDR
ncbi:MAG: L,D-transpeptidase family protein [Roseovarius sp.]